MTPIRTGLKRAWSTPWTTLMGIALGVSIAPGGGFDWLYAIYDDLHPVVRMTGRVVSRDPHSVVLHISGEKLRNCQFLTVRAYAERDSVLVDINHERVDRPMDGHTKPPGSYDIGQWRLWPTTGAERVKVFTKHSCDGRLVLTKIADASLKEVTP